jgi:hypothetical protein
MARSAVVERMVPLLRSQGAQVPGVLPAAGWVDNLSLSGGTAKSYTIPTDTFGNRGLVLRITSTANAWYNPYGAAVIPVADVTTGLASAGMLSHLVPYTLIVPRNCTAISFISTGAQALAIEVWS